MAEAEPVLPRELMRAMIAFVDATADKRKALAALLGGAVGACIGDVGNRACAEALWLYGDVTIAKRPGNEHLPPHLR